MSINTDGSIDKYVSKNPNYRNDLIKIIKMHVDKVLSTVATGIIVSEFGPDQVNDINKKKIMGDLIKLILQPNMNNDDINDAIINITI
jgi:hypothetical protein